MKKEGGGGSLPPSPVDEKIVIVDDSEDGEMEVYEDAGTPFCAEEEEEEKDKNDENLAPFFEHRTKSGKRRFKSSAETRVVSADEIERRSFRGVVSFAERIRAGSSDA